jgi:hypothetical protein
MTLEEIISKAVPYFNYVFETLKQRYRVEIRWDLKTKMDTDYRLIGDEEKLIREIYELWIYIIGKGTARVKGIIRYYIEIEKTRRREYLGYRIVSLEEIEDEIKRFL